MTEKTRELKIVAEWDDEALVWFVSHTDVPGLSADAPTPEEFIKKITSMVPDLLKLNEHLLDDGQNTPVEVILHHQEKLKQACA